jgi:hypothetical protein
MNDEDRKNKIAGINDITGVQKLRKEEQKKDYDRAMEKLPQSDGLYCKTCKKQLSSCEYNGKHPI